MGVSSYTQCDKRCPDMLQWGASCSCAGYPQASPLLQVLVHKDSLSGSQGTGKQYVEGREGLMMRARS